MCMHDAGPINQDCLDIACLRPHEPVMLTPHSNDCTHSMIFLFKQLFPLGIYADALDAHAYMCIIGIDQQLAVQLD